MLKFLLGFNKNADIYKIWLKKGTMYKLKNGGYLENIFVNINKMEMSNLAVPAISIRTESF